MVLTYPEQYRRSPISSKAVKEASKGEEEDVVTITTDNSPDDLKRIEEREFFEKKLQAAGLALEREEGVVTCNETVNYLKISAPWDVLKKYAEVLKFRMPIEVTYFLNKIYIQVQLFLRQIKDNVKLHFLDLNSKSKF